MSLSLKINPVEIPELLHTIGCHLSTADQKTCMLVSRTWYALFQAYFWHHLVYSRSGIPYLEKYGHFVRSLTAYNASDADLVRLAGACHLVQKIDLGLAFVSAAASGGLEILMGNMPHIQDLDLRVGYHCQLKHLVVITRLKRLRRLCLGCNVSYRSAACDFVMLLNAVQKCPTLTSLELVGIEALSKTQLLASSYYRTRREAEVEPISISPGTSSNSPPPSTSSKVLGWFQRLATTRTTLPEDGTKPSAALRAKEPWRKFVLDRTVPDRIPHDYLGRNPDETIAYPKLTRLHLNRLSTALWTSDTPIGLLFRKSPFLQELHVDFSRLFRPHVSEILEAIGSSCFQLESISFEVLRSSNETSPAIQKFFEQHRPYLQSLKLKQCEGLDSVLGCIPKPTMAGLERIYLDSAIYSYPALHQFLTHAKALQHLTWIAEEPSEDQPPPPEQRIEVFVEGWACYGTLRHLDHTNVLTDDDAAFEALFGRMAQMERLVSVGISVEDLRKLVASIMHQDQLTPSQYQGTGIYEDMDMEYGREIRDEDQTIRIGNIPTRHERVDIKRRESYEEYDDFEDKMMEDDGLDDRWTGLRRSIQELTLSQIRISRSTRLLLARQLTAINIRQVLRVFPKLRKIRYQGTVFPLDEAARKVVEGLVKRSVSVTHVSQLPSSAGVWKY